MFFYSKLIFFGIVLGATQYSIVLGSTQYSIVLGAVQYSILLGAVQYTEANGGNEKNMVQRTRIGAVVGSSHVANETYESRENVH